MWMMTRYGMYSVVTNPADPDFEVQIRARDRDDLENLRHRFGALLRPYEIIETPTADYACRIIIPQHEFALLAFYLASDIDYGNFKAEVERTDPARAAVYHRVWAILLNALQPVSFWPKFSQKKDLTTARRKSKHGSRAARRRRHKESRS